MKRFNFGAFQVHASNRDAFEVCRHIAELRTVSPMPVMLVGDDGSGKTHLLYAIVNHVRAGSAKTGLAVVTAREFPDKVRALIADPSPVTRAPSAMLLVDQLERFNQRVEELEGIVRIFLDHHHYVLLASSVHPARLKNLTPGLQALMAVGQIVRIAPELTEERGAPSRGGDLRAPDDVIFQRQQEEIRRLRENLARAEQGAAAAEDAADLRRQIEAERGRIADLTTELQAARDSNETLHQDLDKARAEIHGLRHDLDKNQAGIEALSTLRDDVRHLTAQLELARAQGEETERERAALAARLEERTALEQEIQVLRQELAAARQQSDQAQQAARGLVERAQRLLQQVESGRARFAEVAQAHAEQVTDLGAFPAQQDAGTAGVAEELRRAYDQARQDLEAQLAAAKAEVRQAVKAREEAQEKVDQLMATCATLELDIDRSRDQLGAQTRELEALRHEAAGQVAAANAQAGDIQRAYTRLCSTVDFSRQTGHVVASGLQSLQQELIETAEALSRLATRLAKAVDAETEAVLESREDRDEEAFPGTARPEADPADPEGTNPGPEIVLSDFVPVLRPGRAAVQILGGRGPNNPSGES
jgi:predicted  nucleic acid-binding Zn-ribbon protein